MRSYRSQFPRFAGLLASAVLASFCVGGAARAADASAPYPNKPIRWVVPYAAGGGSDFLARTVGQGLSARIGQTVVVDNKPGGNTAIGASETARSQPDGYTMVSADNGTLVFNPALYKTLSYDPVKDLAPVTLMGRFPMILVVGPTVEAKTVAEFVAMAKARPSGLDYGSAGAGSPHHLAMELFKTETGLNLVHVPYRGAAPALADVAGGQIPAMMADLAAGAGFIKAGKVRALAVAHGQRLPQLPDVPTFGEAGLPKVQAAALVGVSVPGATPPAVIAKLNQQLVATLNDPAIRGKLVDFGIEPVANSPQEYAALLTAERTRWNKLIADLGIKLD